MPLDSGWGISRRRADSRESPSFRFRWPGPRHGRGNSARHHGPSGWRFCFLTSSSPLRFCRPFHELGLWAEPSVPGFRLSAPALGYFLASEAQAHSGNLWRKDRAQADGRLITVGAGPYSVLVATLALGDRMAAEALPSLRVEDAYMAVNKNLTTGVAITVRNESGRPPGNPGSGRGPRF